MQAALQSQIKGFKKNELKSSGWSDDDEDTAPPPKPVSKAAAPVVRVTVAASAADSDEDSDDDQGQTYRAPAGTWICFINQIAAFQKYGLLRIILYFSIV